MRPLVAVVVRVVLLLLVGWGTMTLVDTLSGPVVGANIGAGLAGLAAIAIVALVVGGVDAARTPGLAAVVVRWVVVSALFGVAFTASSQLGAPVPFDWDLFVSELPMSVPFGIGLVLVPAGVGLGVGAALRPSRPTTASALRSPGRPAGHAY